MAPAASTEWWSKVPRDTSQRGAWPCRAELWACPRTLSLLPARTGRSGEGASPAPGPPWPQLTLAVLPAGEEAVAGGAQALVAALGVAAGMLAQAPHPALIQVWPGQGEGADLLSHRRPGGSGASQERALPWGGPPLPSPEPLIRGWVNPMPLPGSARQGCSGRDSHYRPPYPGGRPPLGPLCSPVQPSPASVGPGAVPDPTLSTLSWLLGAQCFSNGSWAHLPTEASLWAGSALPPGSPWPGQGSETPAVVCPHGTVTCAHAALPDVARGTPGPAHTAQGPRPPPEGNPGMVGAAGDGGPGPRPGRKGAPVANGGHIGSALLQGGAGLAVAEEGLAWGAQAAEAALEVVTLVGAGPGQPQALVDICRGSVRPGVGVAQGSRTLWSLHLAPQSPAPLHCLGLPRKPPCTTVPPLHPRVSGSRGPDCPSSQHCPRLLSPDPGPAAQPVLGSILPRSVSETRALISPSPPPPGMSGVTPAQQ